MNDKAQSLRGLYAITDATLLADGRLLPYCEAALRGGMADNEPAANSVLPRRPMKIKLVVNKATCAYFSGNGKSRRDRKSVV